MRTLTAVIGAPGDALAAHIAHRLSAALVDAADDAALMLALDQRWTADWQLVMVMAPALALPLLARLLQPGRTAPLVVCAQAGRPVVTLLPGEGSAATRLSELIDASMAGVWQWEWSDGCSLTLGDASLPWERSEQQLWAAARANLALRCRLLDQLPRWQYERLLQIVRTYRGAATSFSWLGRSQADNCVQQQTLAEATPDLLAGARLILIGSGMPDVQPQERLRPTADPALPAQPVEGYPITLTGMHELAAVVVGGGAVAERKIRGLLAVGAAIRLISPAITPGLVALVDAGRIVWLPHHYAPGDLDPPASLVFAATSDRAVNARIAHDARQRGRLCNVADDGHAGTFHLPAIYRGAGLIIAVSTAGASPARARLLRDQIAAWLARDTPTSPPDEQSSAPDPSPSPPAV